LPADIEFETLFKLTRLNRLIASPFTSNFSFSWKNHGVVNTFSKEIEVIVSRVVVGVPTKVPFRSKGRCRKFFRRSATCWWAKDSVQKTFLAFSTQVPAKRGHIGHVQVVAICVVVTGAISDNGLPTGQLPLTGVVFPLLN